MIIQDLFENKTVAEGVEYSPVTQAITRRILRQRTDLLAKYGPEKVGNAIDEVADFVGDVEEIGSSDVSGWVRHVEQILGDMQGVAEGEISESAFSPEEIAAINQYLDDEISFIELRRGYPGVISKAARQFGTGSARGFRGEMDFYDRMVQARDEGDIMKQGVAEAIVGKPRYSEPHQSGRGLYSAADYMVRTKHQLGSHAYTAVTQVDADNDRYYFIYQKGNKEPVFYATDMGRFEVRTDKLGNRISNAIITAHREATDHGLEKYISGDDESEWDQEKNMAEGRPDVMRHTGDRGVRVVRRGGKPIGEIGIDAEASPGSGQYYVKLYDGSVDLSGYDTAEEALDDIKSALGLKEETPVPTAMGAATSQATAPAQSQAQSAALATAQQQQQKREMQDEIKNKQAEISQLQKSMVSV